MNIPPTEMYKDRHVPTCVRPILGRSLLTNHRIPNCINECTTKKRHDLLKSIPVHHYSQKNCLALSRGERAMKFNDNGSSSKDLLMTDSPSWCKLIYNWTLKHNGLSGHHQSWSYSSTALSGGFQKRILSHYWQEVMILQSELLLADVVATYKKRLWVTNIRYKVTLTFML